MWQWTLTATIIIFGQISAGSTWALLLLIGADIGNIIAVVLAAIAPLKLDLPILLFTILYGIMNATVVGFVLFGRRLKKA